MEELALHILDIASNSVTAKASLVKIRVAADTIKDTLDITISDNGCGMEKSFLKTVTDPFATTRTTRKVGMGLPLFKMAAQNCEGCFDIKSTVGQGTQTQASFKLSHVDRAPLGDLAQTIVTLIGANDSIDYVLEYAVNEQIYIFDTREVKEMLETEGLNSPEILCYLAEMINENIDNLNGGIII